MMNLLTNQTKSTGGIATLEGTDLLTNFDTIVDTVGVCPQENVLLTKMTVVENLIFFSAFKGHENPEPLIDAMVEKFSMGHQRDTLAANLSGGQKRKLQLMIALLGN